MGDKPERPWRGRVIHFFSEGPRVVRFDETVNEKFIESDDEGHCGDEGQLFHTCEFEYETNDGMASEANIEGPPAQRELKSILKTTGLNSIRAEIPIRTLSAFVENLDSAQHYAHKHIAAVLKFVKATTRVPQLAFAQIFSTVSGKHLPKLDNLLQHMLDNNYLQEKLHNGLTYVELAVPEKLERLQLIPYPSECRTNGHVTSAHEFARLTGHTLIAGVAQKVLPDGTVRMAKPTDSKSFRIQPGKRYVGLIDGNLQLFECAARLKGNCWRLFSVREGRYRVVLDEDIEHCVDIEAPSPPRLHFLGKRPMEGEKFVAKVEAITSDAYFVTLDNESLLSLLNINTSDARFQVRAIASGGSLLLAVAELSDLISSFGISSTDFARMKPEFLVSLTDVQQFVLSTQHQAISFEDSEYISTCDLACLLKSSRIGDDVLVRELFLI